MEGPVGLPVAILLALLLSAAFAWWLWREAHVLGRFNTILFWGLRTAATAVVLWMLLSPMRVVVETSSTRRTVIIATDISASMLTVDPAGTSDDFRWCLARSAAAADSGTTEVDSAIAALGMALQALHEARDGLQQHRQDRLIFDAMFTAQASIEHARRRLQWAMQILAESQASPRLIDMAERLVKSFDGPEFEAFSQVTAAIRKNRTPTERGWQESIPDLEHHVVRIRSSAQELGRQLVDVETRQLAGRDPSLIAATRNANRLERVTSSLESLQTSSLQSIATRADVRFAAFDRTFQWQSRLTAANQQRPAADQTTGGGTDLNRVFESLQRERQQQPVAAVFLLTDVAHNEGTANPRDRAAALGDTPVYVVPVGNTKHVRDVVLRSIFAPTVAMRNDDIVIEASLQAYDCQGEVCMIELLQDGKRIDHREISLESDFASRTVRFERHVPTLGTEQFTVAISPIEGELSTDNNQRDFEINVTRSDVKILLADEFPRWEYRYLTQLFRRDAKIECDELLFRPRMVATGRRESTKAFPTSIDEWDHYDIVIMGDVPAEHLPIEAQESLAAYLRQRGGTLVMIAGSDSMPHAYQSQPLMELLPVSPIDDAAAAKKGPFEFRLTPDGRDHQALMIGETEQENKVAWDLVNRNLPIPMISTWRRPRATARTLIAAVPHETTAGDEESRSAFLCWQSVGRGKIIYLAGPETYRLRFLRGDRLHYRFWGQLLRWALAADLGAGTRSIRIRTDKSRYDSREAVQVTVRLTDSKGEPVEAEGVSAQLTGSDERTIPLTMDPQAPGEFRGELRSLPAGDYRIEPIGAAIDALQNESTQEPAFATLIVRNEPSTELTETRCDRALAQQIADATGGQVVPPTAMAELLSLTNLEPIVSTRIEQRPLWVRWTFLWIVFGCLAIEWVVRKKLGLS